MREPLWRPSAARVEATAMEAFRLAASKRAGRELGDYDALHAWSIGSPDDFWSLLASELGVLPGDRSTKARSAHPMPYTRWFEGARLNYARALLYPPQLRDPGQAALISVLEDGAESTLSYEELRCLVARVQGSLARLGVGVGDTVAAFASNLPETVALLIACAGIGARFSSCSPDFGADAAGGRFSQLRPKALFVTTGYRYAGRWFDTSTTVHRLATELGAEAELSVVALPYPGGEVVDLPGVEAWDDFLAAGTAAGDDPGEPVLNDLPFDHPLYVLFSSGTTGTPKAMVHRAGGALLTHAKEHLLHCDVRAGDKAFYFTTCGWMMWNWLVSALARAATVVLYEGSPAEPRLERPFEVIARHGVTFFGTSARFLHTLMGEGSRPADRFDLSSVKTLASTGSPLSPNAFEYVYRHVKSDVHLASISGGTDIVGCFVLGVPTLPVYPGEIQRPGLGVDLAVLDEAGAEVVGEPGELVCRQPLPSMPLRFEADDDFQRYHEAYFSTYPGLWRHGDLVERNPISGGIIVHGRSDATLNPAGVRIGTAEIYLALERVPEVVEAVAVARRSAGDEAIWLLVVLAPGVTLDPKLEARIKSAIRTSCSPRHVPAKILAVGSLPRTRSGKSMEIAVARIVNGGDVSNAEVVDNPRSLDEVRAAVERAGGVADE